MKEQFMEMRMNEQDQTINTMHEIAAGYNNNTNQLNNNEMTKKKQCRKNYKSNQNQSKKQGEKF